METSTEERKVPTSLPISSEPKEAEFSDPEPNPEQKQQEQAIVPKQPSKTKSRKQKSSKSSGFIDNSGGKIAPGSLEIGSYQKKFVKCLTITMVFETIVFAASLTCLFMTPWFHDCSLFNEDVYYLDSTQDLTPRHNFYVDNYGNCSDENIVAFCIDNTQSKDFDPAKFQYNVTCHCTDNFDSLTLWSVPLAEHDSFSNKIVAWPVRGLLSCAAFLKFLITIEYFVSLFVPKLRNNPNSFVIKFCSNWLCGAFLLGSTMHISLSDFNKMCNSLGLGFWAMLFALVMSVPSMLGVLTSTGYYIHIRVLKLELKQQ